MKGVSYTDVYVIDSKTHAQRLATSDDYDEMVLSERDLSHPAAPQKGSSSLSLWKRGCTHLSKYSSPLISAIFGIGWIVISLYTDTVGDRLTLIGLGSFFLGLSVVWMHNILQEGKSKHALKIASLVALTFLFGVLAAGPELGLFHNHGSFLTFSMSSAATFFAARIVHEITKENKEAFALIIAVFAFILGAEYILANGGSQISCGIAGAGVISTWIGSGVYSHLLREKRKETWTASLVALGLLLGSLGFFGEQMGLDLGNRILLGGMGASCLVLFAIHHHAMKKKQKEF